MNEDQIRMGTQKGSSPRCSQSEAPWRGDECADGPQELSTELLSQGGVASEEGQSWLLHLGNAGQICGCCLESVAHVVREPGLPEKDT